MEAIGAWWKGSPGAGRSPWRLFFLLAGFTALAGCVRLVSYYDSVTYQNLTNLKARTSIALDSLSRDLTGKSEAKDLDDIRLGIEQAYEYEKGKELNDDTAVQLSKIRDIFGRLQARIQDRSGQGKGLDAAYVADMKDQLSTAFDLAIETESGKIKKKEG